MNVILLITLMDFVTSANGEGLIRRLQEILKVEIIDLKSLYTYLFGANDSEAINIHFEATGYDSSDFQINAGPSLLIIFLLPFYFLLTFTLSRCCRRQKCKLWAQRKVKETYFNAFISFMEA